MNYNFRRPHEFDLTCCSWERGSCWRVVTWLAQFDTSSRGTGGPAPSSGVGRGRWTPPSWSRPPGAGRDQPRRSEASTRRCWGLVRCGSGLEPSSWRTCSTGSRRKAGSRRPSTRLAVARPGRTAGSPACSHHPQSRTQSRTCTLVYQTQCQAFYFKILNKINNKKNKYFTKNINTNFNFHSDLFPIVRIRICITISFGDLLLKYSPRINNENNVIEQWQWSCLCASLMIGVGHETSGNDALKNIIWRLKYSIHQEAISTYCWRLTYTQPGR